MIRLLAALALLVALTPPARSLPRVERTLAVAGVQHAPPLLPHVNTLEWAVLTHFTPIAPFGTAIALAPMVPRSEAPPRRLLTSRLLL